MMTRRMLVAAILVDDVDHPRHSVRDLDERRGLRRHPDLRDEPIVLPFDLTDDIEWRKNAPSEEKEAG
jgi:hypothetical protein